MIRNATTEDIPSIIKMSKLFWAETIYEEELDELSVSVMAQACIDHGLCCVLVVNGDVSGFACGLAMPLLGNNSVMQGSEIAWWVDEDHRSGRNGINLLRWLEMSAKDAGIKYWNMMYMESSMPKQVKKMYERLGYIKNETTYTRKL